MSTLNEDALGTALKDAARRYAVPPSGAEQILGAATTASQAPRRGADRASRGWSRQRLGLVAAVAIVLAVLAGALLTSGLGANHYTPRLASGAPSTTVPNQTTGGVTNGLGVVYGSPSYKESTRVNGTTRPGSSSTSQGQTLPQTKVVSVGSIALRVAGDSFDSVLARISTLAVSVGGYVASSKSTAGSQAGGVPSAMIELRVPQKRFSSVVAKAERLGRVVSAETNSTDVTAEYVDYQAQIGAAKASRAQYLAIMARASSISDILAIQAQLNVIDSEIQQLEGQRNLLANQAAYGTLTIDVNQGAPALGHTSGVLRSWNQSISGFVAGVEWIIRAAGPALFALLCLAALLIFGRLGWRAGQRRFI
jgi:hypothetical protein